MFAAPNNNPGLAGAITPEMLAKSVSDALGQIVGQAIAAGITHALAEYQRANGLAPEPAIKANIENVAINAAADFRARSTESPLVVHGNMTVLQQLRRDMGIDDFLSDDTVFQTPPSLDAIRGAAVSERQPVELLENWSEELEWLAAELGQVRDPETVGPEWMRDTGTGPENLSPRARLGAWLAACDMRPRLATFAADTIAWLRSGTSELARLRL